MALRRGAQGGVFDVLTNRGYEHLYKPDRGAFREWLQMLSEPTILDLLDPLWAGSGSGGRAGLLTARFFSLTVANPSEVAFSVKGSEVEQVWLENTFVKSCVRTESLAQDLISLFESLPIRFSMTNWRDVIRSKSPANTTQDMVELRDDVLYDAASIDRVQSTDKWLFELNGFPK